MNDFIKFILTLARLSDKSINDLDKAWPGIKEIAIDAKKLQPIIDKAAPHIDALIPIVDQAWPIVKDAWPRIKGIIPIADELEEIANKVSK